MSLPGLLLLSSLIVHCSGCQFMLQSIKNIKTTIDSDSTSFRMVFPKDYRVSHHYQDNMLCNTDPCCVFNSALFLQEAWSTLLDKLWPEHVNYSFIEDVRTALDDIAVDSTNRQRFQEEKDIFLKRYSSPEELLNYTSVLLSRRLVLGCSVPLDKCPLPITDPTVVEKEDEQASWRARLTTRAIINEKEGEKEKRMDHSQPPSNGILRSLRYSSSLLGLCGLCWLL